MYYQLMCELLKKTQFEIKFGEPHTCTICGTRDEGSEDETIEEIEKTIVEKSINKK